MKNMNDYSYYKREKISLMFYAATLEPYMCGSTIHAIDLFFALYNTIPSGFELNICISRELDKMFDVSHNCPDVGVIELIEADRVYDIAVIPSHSYSGNSVELPFLDNHADKWVMWILDSIYMMYAREDEIRKKHSLAKQCIDNLDGMIFFSNAAKQDLKDKFPECENIENTLTKVIPIVGNYSYDETKDYDLDLPYNDFYLIIGNTYKHKMIPETIEVISNTDNNYIVVGTEKEFQPYNNVYCYPSGGLSDDMMCNLYARCMMLIFPSVYEGFGLPVVEALNFGKDVIAFDHDINHELEGLCEAFKGHIHYYKALEQIPKMLDDIIIDNSLEYNSYTRTWNDVAKDVYELLSQVAEQPIDEEKLNRRHLVYDLVDASLYLRHQTLVNIAKADYSKLNCGKVVDIYGAGVNGKIFYKNIKDHLEVGCFVDRNHKVLEEDIECVGIDEYKYFDNHIIVITPEYDIGRIRKNLCDSDKRINDIVISVSEFIDIYIC